MKTVKIPKELEYLLEEARPELEVDNTLSLPKEERGQDGKPCPHISYCHVRKFGRINCMNESTIRSCQTNKFYNKYPEYDQMFI